MGINGETTIKGIKTDLDVSFGDIRDNLDFAAQIHFEVCVLFPYNLTYRHSVYI